MKGWGSWREERRYLAKDGEHVVVVVSKRTQDYGDGSKVFTKTERRKLSRADRLWFEAERGAR